MENTQPGQVIMPNLPEEPKPNGDGAPMPERPTEDPAPQPTPTPAPTPPPDSFVYTGPEVNNHGDDLNRSAYPHGSNGASHDAPNTISWTASEFIDHEKGVAWYSLLALVGAGVVAVVYLLTRDIFSTVVVLFVVLAFAVFAARKPRVQEYTMTFHGLQIGPKLYSFQDYKYFSVTQDGAVAGIVFMPLRRFTLPLTIYVLPDKQKQIIDFLSSLLPLEEHRTDAVDGLMRRIHF